MEIVKTKKGENLNKTKNIENSLQIETPCSVVVGWTSVTTTTERFPTLAEAMAISEFSFNFQFLVVILLCLMQFFEDGKKISNRQCLTFSCQIGHNVMLSLSLGFHPAFKNVHTDPLSERNTSF